MATGYRLHAARHFKYQRLDQSGIIVESPLRYLCSPLFNFRAHRYG